MADSQSSEQQDKLGREYSVCFDNWRFFVGLRFTVMAFMLTLNAGLLYQFLKLLGEPASRAIWFIGILPVVGLASLWGAFVIENRTRHMYFACIQRAKAIEERAVAANGEAKKVVRLWPCEPNLDTPEEAKRFSLGTLLDDRCPLRITSSMRWGIYFVYGTLGVIWVVLGMVSAGVIAVTMCRAVCGP